MRERSRLLTPRSAHGSFEDLAERVPLIAHQRVQRRLRPRAGRRASVTGVVGAGACLALLAGGTVLVHWFLTSPRFAVARVEIRGIARSAPPELLAAAAIAPGQNIFGIRAEAVASRVEQVPGIRRAEVIRELPNRVTLVVEERQPFTLTHAGRLHWLDEEGVLLGEASRAVAPGLPLVSGLLPEELGSARRPAADRTVIAIGLLRALLRSGSPLLSRLSEIDASRPDGPVFYTIDGTEIRLSNEHWEAELARLEGLAAQISSEMEPVEYVDLRFRDLVVFKPRIR